MIAPPRSLVTAVVLLLTTLAAQAAGPSDACRRHLMNVDHLRQLYTGGAGMQVRVPPVSEAIEGLTAGRVYEAAWRKLSAHGLHEADATQWLDVEMQVDSAQYTMILSLRRWADDLGYGLPGEITVWVLGSGNYHDGNADRVISRVLQHMDSFIMLYAQAQSMCGD